MKLFKIVLLLIFMVSNHSANCQGAGNQLFDNSYVHDIHVFFQETNFWDTLESYYAELYGMGSTPTGPKKYLQAQIMIDGMTLDSVGIRQKGFSSNWGASLSSKKPLKVDINEFVSGQKFDGLKKFNLNNAFDDPSMMRDLLAYDLMRKAGVKAPRTAYANVYLNGVHWGVYMLVEQVDDTFLKQNFSNGNGNLYKCIDNTNLEWLGNSANSYMTQFELKTNEDINDWTNFIRFVKTINKVGLNNSSYVDSVNAIFDVQEYLKALAIDVAILNWDSYYDHGRNFYIYHNPDDGKFHWIPWDYNFSFSDTPTDLLMQNSINNKPLINNLLSNSSFKDQYFDAYCDILDNNFTLTRLSPIIDSTVSMLTPHHQNSTNEFFSTADFLSSTNSDVLSSWGFLIPGLKPMITDRRNDITNELAQLNHTCTNVYAGIGDLVINEFMAENDNTTNVDDQDGEYDDWVELYNNTTTPIDLLGYYLSDDFGNTAKWVLPDTTIAANGYLVIWADNDGDQAGLHANFKLSKNGEELILSTPNNVVLDSLTFGVQALPYSYARQPNGTGPFEDSQPTLGSYNLLVNTDRVENLDFVVYPNPANNYINIQLREVGKVQNVQLINLHGQMIFEKSVNVNDTQVAFEVNQLPAGMYVINLQTYDNYNVTSKVLIAH